MGKGSLKESCGYRDTVTAKTGSRSGKYPNFSLLPSSDACQCLPLAEPNQEPKTKDTQVMASTGISIVAGTQSR